MFSYYNNAYNRIASQTTETSGVKYNNGDDIIYTEDASRIVIANV